MTWGIETDMGNENFDQFNSSGGGQAEPTSAPQDAPRITPAPAPEAAQEAAPVDTAPVSYTHLTLPTIYPV